MQSSVSRRLFALAAFALCPLALSSDLVAQPTFTDQATTILGGVNYNSRSASLGDYDNDGDLDLFFQGAAGAQQLFRNNLIGTGR